MLTNYEADFKLIHQIHSLVILNILNIYLNKFRNLFKEIAWKVKYIKKQSVYGKVKKKERKLTKFN